MLSSAGVARLYTIDLVTGGAALIGDVGGATVLAGLALGDGAPVATTTTLTSPANPAFDPHVTVTATVTPATATGIVEFNRDGLIMQGCQAQPVSAGGRALYRHLQRRIVCPIDSGRSRRSGARKKRRHVDPNDHQTADDQHADGHAASCTAGGGRHLPSDRDACADAATSGSSSSFSVSRVSVDDGQLAGFSSPDASGQASYVTFWLGEGVHTLTAAFNGNGLF